MGRQRERPEESAFPCLHWRKLTTLHQGDSSVEELIREFEIHGPISGLGNMGLVDCFEQAIHPRLRESIYRLEPMPSTWAEWKPMDLDRTNPVKRDPRSGLCFNC